MRATAPPAAAPRSTMLTEELTPTPSAIVPSSSTQSSLLSVPGSQGRAASQRSVGRGDLDEAIRSIHNAQRRRPRPVSKIFLDGSTRQSRVVFD
jgi:hypothetical protein